MNNWFEIYLITIGLIVFGGGLLKLIKKVLGKYEDVPKPVQIEELISISMLAIGVFGCYGIMYSFDIGSTFFWKIYLVLMLVIFIIQFWLPKQAYLKKELPENFYFIGNVANIIFYLPFFYILTSYAFFSD